MKAQQDGELRLEVGGKRKREKPRCLLGIRE